MILGLFDKFNNYAASVRGNVIGHAKWDMRIQLRNWELVSCHWVPGPLPMDRISYLGSLKDYIYYVVFPLSLLDGQSIQLLVFEYKIVYVPHVIDY